MNTELMSHHQQEELGEGQRRRHVLPPPRALLSGIHLGQALRGPVNDPGSYVWENPRSRAEKASYLRRKDGKAAGCTLGGQHPVGRSRAQSALPASRPSPVT